MTLTMRREGTIAFVEMNNPPVNAIGLSVREGLQRAIDWVNEQSGLSRVILTGTGRAFAAGGDAREFDAAPVAPHLPDLTNQIEACAVPWVAAITGVALGGGCELALACRYRIAAPHVKIGLPEVTLGVVPGAGGTQRLPRLIGMVKALDMIATGKPITAQQAESIGLIDGVADDPIMVARQLDIGSLELANTVGEMSNPIVDAASLDAAQILAAKKSPNQIAPLRAIGLVAAAATLSLSEGMIRERDTFLELRDAEQSTALRHIFFAQRAAKAPKWLTAAPNPLAHIAVVGGGMMGAGIAYGLLNAGIKVTLLETDVDTVARVEENVNKIIEASLKRGLISATEAAARRDDFTASDDYAAAADAALVIEAAFESMDVKKDIFAKLSMHLAPDAVLATNTSYLDIDELASTLPDPSRVVGLHFFAPAHIMKLLEIVRGDATSDAALATGFALAKRLRKIPVLAGVCDGFIGNRILARYREAADTVLMDGSTPWEVDEAMVAFGYAMGPYEAQDLSGLDIAHANRRRQDATRDQRRRYIPIADRMIELGKLGKKSGAGWYRHPGGGGKVEDPIVADLALEEARFAKITRCDYTAAEMSERLVLAMINEACNILHEGIAASARDIDLVTVFGYGFPKWRGGLMHYADHLGVKAICDGIEALAKEDPVVWKLSPMLAHCLATGTVLRDYANAP
ncbi:MAG: enoyl-CoA hydratase/isomerase family protein [Rhodobacteraceae bacterium]|nr:enoyl-CoA hydratase/isomerase family protein [Paracoccaceae bacterium]